MEYQIKHKDTSRHILFAAGFYDLERAKAWIDKFNPQMYTDKTFKRGDLVIVDTKTKAVVYSANI